MDPKELRGLLEAYSEVYAPQDEIDEAVKGESSERRQDLAVERRAGHRPKSAKEGENYASHKLSQMAYVKRKRMGEDVEQIDEISAGLAGKVVNARIERTGAAADRENRARTPQNVRATVDAADKEAKARKLAAGVRARRVANEEVEQIDELKKSTLGSYVKKASKDVADRSFDHGESERRQYDDHPDDEREGKRIETRKKGISRAVDKMMKKEHFDIFDTVLEFLQTEGYAETLEEAEWLMANVIDEEAIDIILGEEQLDEVSKTDDTTRSLIKQYAGKKGISFEPGPRWDASANRGKGANLSPKQVEKQRRKKFRAEDYVNEAIYSEKGKAKAAEMIAARSTPSGRAKLGKGANVAQIRQIRGSGRGSFDREGLGGTPMTPTMAKNPIKKQNYIGTGNKAARRAGTYQEEFVDESQHARENPEKYEREQSKKSAPVRGEKTPMPPRGDKRREDFERWYAANVR
jgi:hypothetical protein